MQSKNKSAKKALLKKIIKGKKIGKNPSGASPIKMDNGLGSTPLNNIGSGGGSNLGVNGVF